MIVVLDTCALLWWTLSPEDLSDKATDLLGKVEQSGRLIISSISIWEISVKHKKKQIDLGMSVEKYISLLENVGAEFLPVSNRDWLMASELNWRHKDPVDRVIVGVAKRHNAPLITKDQSIRNFYDKAVW